MDIDCETCDRCITMKGGKYYLDVPTGQRDEDGLLVMEYYEIIYCPECGVKIDWRNE